MSRIEKAVLRMLHKNRMNMRIGPSLDGPIFRGETTGEAKTSTIGS